LKAAVVSQRPFHQNHRRYLDVTPQALSRPVPTYPEMPLTSHRSGMGPVAQAVFKTAAVV